MSSLPSPDSGNPKHGGGGDGRDPLRIFVVVCVAGFVALCAAGGAGIETSAVLIAAHIAMTLAVAAGVLAGISAGALAGMSVAVTLNRILR
jgi:hypothetical protein